jgi:exopolyphosphatase / guanosine-5'-triphosphate,3'-diphosphate pyrophosphatase
MSTNLIEQQERTVKGVSRAVRPVAVIDVGTTSLRMAVAEIHPDGEVHRLETLTRAVSLGKDTFTRGRISKSTMEDCVNVLKSYRQLLKEYDITQPDQIRIVATSAVREAENRLAFLDRVYSATGLEIEPIDEAEVSRITYLGIQPHLKADTELAASCSVVVEIGGGSTEMLVVHGGEVLYSHTYRLGSLRLRETVDSIRASQAQSKRIIRSQIERTVGEVVQYVPNDRGPVELVALGGDVRFASSQLLLERDPKELGRLPVDDLAAFTDKILSRSADQLVQKYHVGFPDAETMGPALLGYVLLARALGVSQILVSNTNLRDGLLEDLAANEAWTDDFREQVTRSAIELGRKFDFDEAHSRHVGKLCRDLFRGLQNEHQLDSRYELLLYLAGLLHEIGLFVSNRAYHKHSFYLIINSELFGLAKQDMLLMALVARYHRRASPKPNHEGYVSLARERRIAVSKLAAILRVADALDRSYSQRVDEIRVFRERSKLVIAVPDVDDLSLEQLALKQTGSLFEEIFGIPVLLRTVRL